MAFWLKDYASLLEKLEYLQFKLTDPEMNEQEKQDTEKQLQFCVERKAQFEQLVSKFDSLEQRILFRKYVEGKTLESIASELEYSANYIYNKHSEILKILRFYEK
ncbi:hypothetical protein [Lysinibacillus sp. BNK-21]|uniref:hypothetical protein n=1 Tax=Lysinibacillus sp. BNK-21 TaxID=3376156 RepID=UPI003B437FAC